MAGVRVELLMVQIVMTLLLVSVTGWEWINETQLPHLYEKGQLGKPRTFTSPDDSSVEDSKDAVPEVEGAATSEDFNPSANYEYQVGAVAFGPRNWASGSDGGFQVELVDAPPSRWASGTDGGSQVELVDAPPRSWASGTDGGSQVELVDAPPRSWASGTDGGSQVELVDAPPSSWASGSDGGSQVELVDAPPRSWASSSDGGFQVELVDAPPSSWASGTDGGSQVELVDAPPRSWDSGTDGGSQVELVDAPPRSWDSGTDGGSQVELVDAPPSNWASSTSLSSTELDVVCSDVGFHITLPTDQLSEVKVLGSKDLLSVMDAPESCGYEVNSFKNTLTVPFTGCNVKNTDRYSLQLLYVDKFDQTQIATASCEKSPKFDPGLFARSSSRHKPTSKCSYPTVAPPRPTLPVAQTCSVPPWEQVKCGKSGISLSACKMMGCCIDFSTYACYYPLDECTADHHFVFAIRSNSAPIPVDPTKLIIPGNPNCKPVFVNHKVAIFKFKVTECGTHAYEVGETKIYLAEVQTIVKALSLKYGVITRSDPLRFLVECRYSKTGSGQHSMASVGYMVKIPSSHLPSAVISNGLYSVQLRIAKDHTYSSYYPTYHQPLRLLLGKPVYLELNLKSPKPDAVILVNYCIAYPRSAKNALVLIYQGCANPHDPNVSILKVHDLPKNRHQRRFVVRAFQFMDQTTNKYLDEEIYFMCSTEVCRELEKKCQQQCFDRKAPHGFVAQDHIKI
ncbi:uncharacterized protein LOC122864925 [Siniperca chuatsi]|uniref:uncharacterized protein LOC122864925 n=1 Tax=Siniperca chuatsi TaxID=119488 RepID=UPI001CE0D03E|nr:uncharacterized protein LOC122864925 [Siniperca chuatsi]